MSTSPFTVTITGLAGSGRRSIARQLAMSLDGIMLDIADFYYALAWQYFRLRPIGSSGPSLSNCDFVEWMKVNLYFTVKQGEILEVCSFPILCDELRCPQYRERLIQLLQVPDFAAWVNTYVAELAEESAEPVVLLLFDQAHAPHPNSSPHFFLRAREEIRARRLNTQRIHLQERERHTTSLHGSFTVINTTSSSVAQAVSLIRSKLDNQTPSKN